MECYRIALRESLGAVSFVGRGNITISRLTCDSRRVWPGDLFVAVTGTRHDGRHFVDDAISRGAVAILSETPLADVRIPQCIVPDCRAAYATLCMALRADPARALQVAGVTGTNGKTTVTWLLRAIIRAAGHRSGVLGTIEYSDGVDSIPAELTTPDAAILAYWFERMVRRQVAYCAMEISSHALDQRRCAGVPLAAAAITNVTQDHFDYHQDADRYRIAKARIASLLRPGARLLLNADDAGCRSIAASLQPSPEILWFGLDASTRLRAEVELGQSREQRVTLHLQHNEVEVRSSLTGRHNASNLLAAALLAEELGLDAAAIRDGLESVRAVPGRLERIDAGQPFEVLVDFAHTPDGLANCLRAVRETTTGRVICVFGAGGDRDRSKRPLMAQAAEVADEIIVTSDNPRNEAVMSIIDDICAGFSTGRHPQICPERADAIRQAVQAALPGDAVVIAGRGHEHTQQIGTRQICFDDRKVARSAVMALLARTDELTADARVPARQIPA